MNSDEKFMKMAISLASKGSGFTSPNPLVGAVLVKDNQIIGQGYHKSYGANHAEIEAILDAQQKGKKVNNTTLYVNLEPCFHEGKTPPCAQRIIKEGIKKVVIGIKDPNSKTNGKSIKLLRENGVEVIVDVLKNECANLNEIFFYNIKNELPFVALKAAVTLNGKIGEVGERIQISSEKSLKFAHALRQKYDGILIGSSTVVSDNPELNIRCLKNKKDPVRIIFDKNCILNPTYRVFKNDHYLLCIARKKITKKYISSFNKSNILEFDLENGNFNLQKILKKLYQRNIASILVEGGSKIFTSFLTQKIPQKGYFITAPKFICSKNSIPLFPEDFEEDFKFDVSEQKISEDDIITKGYFRFIT